MENDEMRALADALWAYFRVKYLKDLLAGNVSFYTATVTSAPTDGEICVQRPYDAPVTLRYAWTASSLQVGDKCTVLVFGDPSNAFVIGNGTLSDGGGGDLVETVNTGVNGIFAYKCGRTVSVTFHDYKPSSSSDNPVLPQSIWPNRTVHAVVDALNNDGYGRVTIDATTGSVQPILPDYTKYYYGTISYFSQS